MKVLHLISSGGMYGAEAVILNLSRTLAESGHASAVASFSNAANPNRQLHEAAVKAGIESHTIACRGQMDRSVFPAIRGLVKQTRADVVHAHGYKADIYCYLALRKLPVPMVSTCHTWYDNDLLVTLYGKADRLVLRGFARVVAVSAEVKQRLLRAGVREQKIRIVRNGIDLRPFASTQRSLRGEYGGETLLVGLIGRLAFEKGVDVFLSAIARIAADVPEAKFLVVGEGPDGEKLERLIDELKIRDKVRMLGRRDDMASVYASLDLMVSSSRQEGLPMAILEGMASGLPLIATAVGEVPTVVRDGVTGLVVPSGEVERLADAILELLRDAEKRRRFGAAGRKLIADEYSAERMAADYLAVYREAVAAVTL